MDQQDENAGRSGTLAGASGKGLEKFLQKGQAGRKANRGKPRTTGGAGVLPERRGFDGDDTLCGAPAGILDDEEQPAVKADGRSRVEDAQPSLWTQGGGAGFGPAAEGDEEAEEDWESASDPDDFDQPQDPLPAGLVISLSEGDKVPTKGKARPRFTEQEKESAGWMHQAHLLCLIGRARMLEMAASDPLLQGVCLSAMDPAQARKLQGSCHSLLVPQLTEFAAWFRDAYTVLEEPRKYTEEETKQFEEAGGVAASAACMQKVVLERRGGIEELMVVFVAMLRASGVLVRYVRALDPLPWKPAHADSQLPRQRKNPLKRKADTLEPSGGAGEASGKQGKAQMGNGAAKKGAKKATKKPENGKARGGKARNAGRGRGKGRRKAASSEEAEAESSDAETESDVAVPLADDESESGGDGSEAEATLKPAPRAKVKGGGSKAKQQGRDDGSGAAVEGGAKGVSQGRKGLKTDTPGGRKQGGRVTRGSVTAEPAVEGTPVADEEDGEGKDEQEGTGGKQQKTGSQGDSKAASRRAPTGSKPSDQSSGKKRRKRRKFEGEPSDDEGHMNGALGMSQEEVDAKKGKSLGELEFENQMAMALMASAAAVPAGKRQGVPADVNHGGGEALNAVRGAKQRGAVGRGVAIAKIGSGRGWAQGDYQAQTADTWAEVYCEGEDDGQGRWVHVQPLLGWVDKPEMVENASLRYGQLAYVAAFSGGGAKDVTSRYVSNLARAHKARGGNAWWWEYTLKPMRAAEMNATNAHLTLRGASRPPQGAEGGAKTRLPARKHAGAAGGKGGRSGGGGLGSSKRQLKEVTAAAKREDKELKKRVEEQQMEIPTTLAGFKNHKHYILQRNITRYVAIRPEAKKAGIFKGEPFYLKSDVSELHTADKWVPLGFEVLATELGTPFKVVAKRGSKKNSGKGERDAGDEEVGEGTEQQAGDPAQQTRLYGRWQTRPWEAPVAANGIVPKNERGNVQCPPLTMSLPKGTAHIKRQRVVGVCKQLGIDYAMAMTGWDVRGGRSVPRMEGVVVCEEFAQAVEEMWQTEQREIAEREAEKRMEGARSTWAALLRAIFLRMGLQGDGAQQAPGKGKAAKKKPSAKRAAAKTEPGASPPSKKSKGKGGKSTRNGAAGKGRGKGTPEEDPVAEKHSPRPEKEQEVRPAAEIEEI